MIKWLGRWTSNLVVPGSSPPPCYSLDLFSVAPSSTPWLQFVNSQLVCLQPVGIFKHFMFIYNVCFLFVCIDPEKPHWGSGQLRLCFSRDTKVLITLDILPSFTNAILWWLRLKYTPRLSSLPEQGNAFPRFQTEQQLFQRLPVSAIQRSTSRAS